MSQHVQLSKDHLAVTLHSPGWLWGPVDPSTHLTLVQHHRPLDSGSIGGSKQESLHRFISQPIWEAPLGLGDRYHDCEPQWFTIMVCLPLLTCRCQKQSTTQELLYVANQCKSEIYWCDDKHTDPLMNMFTYAASCKTTLRSECVRLIAWITLVSHNPYTDTSKSGATLFGRVMVASVHKCS